MSDPAMIDCDACSCQYPASEAAGKPGCGDDAAVFCCDGCAEGHFGRERFCACQPDCDRPRPSDDLIDEPPT